MKTTTHQDPSKNRTLNKGALFFYLSLLTILFFILEISFFIRFNSFYLADIKEISNYFSIPAQAIPPILMFVGIQLLLHFLFLVLIWAMAVFISVALNSKNNQFETIGFALWGIGLGAIIFSNQYYYPNSNFCALTKHFISHALAGDISFILIAIFSVGLLLAFWGAIKILIHMPKTLISIAAFVIGVVAYHCYHQNDVTFEDKATEERPNIILVGVDSLRPDFLGFFGHEKQTPHLDNFLNQATVFSESLTPLARTFPSWASILTGESPKQTNIRTDLDNLNQLVLQTTLPNLLRQQGYATVFATDETRFSNIDQRFGFDHVITPPMGLNDFLIGGINDFPLSNLWINTQIGKWLFPYNYGNRPAFATYDPDSFLKLLTPALESKRDKPLFMAVHFCLPHFPYLYAHQPLNDQSIYNYQSSVQRVDQQFNAFMALLQKNKLLNHAIIVLLSDHGEAIELHGDRATDPDLFISEKKSTIPHFYPPMLETEKVDESAGHGTDVLGLPQYHTVLAFKLYGLKSNQTHVIPGRVSLLDIKPTVLDLLNMKYAASPGDSLKENIIGNKMIAESKHRDFFIESDFSPIAIRTAHPETRDVVLSGMNYYQIDPLTTRVTVKNSMRQLIISSKQYAVFRGDWVLALYPQENKTMQPILVNLKTGFWTDDLQTQFAKQSPAEEMLLGLKAYI